MNQNEPVFKVAKCDGSNQFIVGNVKINNELFTSQLVNYRVVDRAEAIDTLSKILVQLKLSPISEIKRKEMEDSLIIARACNDEFVMQYNVAGNSMCGLIVTASHEPERFNEICNRFIQINFECNSFSQWVSCTHS